MKWSVQLYVGGTVFKEEVQAVNRNDAIETAKARNPKARVIGANQDLSSLMLSNLMKRGSLNVFKIMDFFMMIHIKDTQESGKLKHQKANYNVLKYINKRIINGNR